MNGPIYDQAEVRKLATDVAARFITIVAENDYLALGLVLQDVWDALSELDTPRCRFHKAMESDKQPGDWFDVYHVSIGGRTIYLKFKVKVRPAGDQLVVVSF